MQQHIAHIFIGNELVAFRDKFATYYRENNVRQDPSYFTALLCNRDEDGNLCMSADDGGVQEDTQVLDADNLSTRLGYYIDDLFSRKVTINNAGTNKLVVIVWGLLYEEDVLPEIKMIVDAVGKSRFNIGAEVVGFTAEAVNCFVPIAQERLAPYVYQQAFQANIKGLLSLRTELSALRLVENRNQQGVSLNFTEDTMARVCAEFAGILSCNYLQLTPTVPDRETPIESFGLSSIKFDREYFRNYLRHKVLMGKMQEQGVNDRNFNINALAAKTDPVIGNVLAKIQALRKQIVNAQANLAVAGQAGNTTNVVAQIDNGLDEIQKQLQEGLDNLFADGKINFSQREALLSLILGEDCNLFVASAVRADEKIVDDVVNDSMQFFVNFDSDGKILSDVSIDEIKDIRNQMRNTSIALRQYQDELKALAVIRQQHQAISHIQGNRYSFDGVKYKLDLDIDQEPLEKVYNSQSASAESVDLRDSFQAVRSQGEQGSCSAFAVSSVIEYMAHNKLMYSPAFLYYNGRALNNNAGKDAGSSIYHVLRAAMEQGVCQEKYMPYDDQTFDKEPSPEAIEDAKSCRVLEAQTILINDKLIDNIKSALCEGHPVIIAARVFDSFSDAKGGVVTMPSAKDERSQGKGDKHGRHAMVLCGYSDKGGMFLARNSWGKDFGRDGYCYIPYEYARKYILQACVISQLSVEHDVKKTLRTLNFDENDASIKEGVLANKISLGERELDELKKRSDALRRAWSSNEAALGNANTQTKIADFACQKITEEIAEKKSEEAKLQHELVPKTKRYRRELIKNFLWSLAAVFIMTIYVCLLPTSILIWILFAVAVVVMITWASTAGYKWWCYRQNLRDEIQQIALEITQLEQQREMVRIQSHIHGAIMRKFGAERNRLVAENQRLKSFNSQMRECYKRMGEEIQQMTSDLPYPFMNVIDNADIDRYYNSRKPFFDGAINLDDLYREYNALGSLSNQIMSSQQIDAALNRDINKFNLSLLITNTNGNRWQFLPPAVGQAAIFKDLDSRGAPFCTYQAEFGHSAKFLIFKDATHDVVQQMSQYFSLQPQEMASDDPDTITLLNIIRYNVEHG